MPRIPEHVIKSVFFLYRNRADAEACRNPGGTGFILATGLNHLTVSDGPAFYAVTNSHVACTGGFPVIRLDTLKGGTDIREFEPDEWQFIPYGPDVAMVPLELEYGLRHEIPYVHAASFVPKPKWRGIGPYEPCVGDDVFMLGLFVDHSGLTTNVPSARFGNISMLPSADAPIKQPTKFMGESYVVDMHSRTGFSGSPFFMFRTFGSDLTTNRYEIESLKVDRDRVRNGIHGDIDFSHAEVRLRTLFYFLGIHWGQFPEKWELKDKPLEEAESHLITDGKYVDGWSGMTCVVPTWDILKVLDLPKLKIHRENLMRSERKD